MVVWATRLPRHLRDRVGGAVGAVCDGRGSVAWPSGASKHSAPAIVGPTVKVVGGATGVADPHNSAGLEREAAVRARSSGLLAAGSSDRHRRLARLTIAYPTALPAEHFAAMRAEARAHGHFCVTTPAGAHERGMQRMNCAKTSGPGVAAAVCTLQPHAGNGGSPFPAISQVGTLPARASTGRLAIARVSLAASSTSRLVRIVPVC